MMAQKRSIVVVRVQILPDDIFTAVNNELTGALTRIPMQKFVFAIWYQPIT